MLVVLLIFVSKICTALADFVDNSCVYEPDIFEDNLLIRTCWYSDDTGQKTVNSTVGYAGKTDVYEHLLDEEGRYEHISEAFLDPDGNLMSGLDGYAKMTTEYDLHESGPVCRWCFTEGDPDNNICGYTHRYYDNEENPVMIGNEDGFEGFRYHIIDRSELETFLFSNNDSSDIVTMINMNGYVFAEGGYAVLSVSMERTDDEFVQRYSYYGTDEKPILRDGVYAVYEMTITKHTAEHRFYGTDGELVNTPLGYASSIKTYTDDNKESFIRYYDADNQPTTDTELGVHAIHDYYGQYSRQIPRTDYLDVNDELTNNSKGYCTVINEYIESESPSKTVAMNLSSRYPISTTYYDKDGNQVEIME